MVKYEDASLINKLSFLTNVVGFLLVLFSFHPLLDQYNMNNITFDPDHLTMFVIAFFFYLLSALIIACITTMEEVEDTLLVKVIYIISAFIAGVFLVVGLGLFGEYTVYGIKPSPYGLLVGVHALVLIFLALALGVASLVMSHMPARRSTQGGSTDASGPTQTTFTG